jgi:long-chain acyl-CoA synthetase
LDQAGLADSLFDTAARTPDLPMLARRRAPGSAVWDEVTAAGFRDEVGGLAKGLIAGGLAPGDRGG